MMSRILMTGFVLVLVCNTFAASAAEDFEWELKRDRDGIEVHTRDVEGSKFKAVKSVMTISVSLAELVALVRDTEACPEWADLCKKAMPVEEVSETELYVYTLNDLPWPVSDRDAVAHVVWRQDPVDLGVTMTATVVSDKLPIERGTVRLSYGETSWTFLPRDDKSIEVISWAHVDPAGATPAWLTNRLLVDSPFETMVGMRNLVLSGRYAGAKFNFLVEP